MLVKRGVPLLSRHFLTRTTLVEQMLAGFLFRIQTQVVEYPDRNLYLNHVDSTSTLLNLLSATSILHYFSSPRHAPTHAAP